MLVGDCSGCGGAVPRAGVVKSIIVVFNAGVVGSDRFCIVLDGVAWVAAGCTGKAHADIQSKAEDVRMVLMIFQRFVELKFMAEP